MENFGKISEIDCTRLKSWANRYFLTFDMDWAHEDIIQDVINLVEEANASATWFVTNQSEAIPQLRENPRFELGIHPNFNPLLLGKGGEGHAEVVQKLMELIPEATSSRSHSITDGGLIRHALRSNGITHESNINIPEASGMSLHPFYDSYGLVRVPYCWADEHAWAGTQSDDFENIQHRLELAVFDFHPIHVFLNTECLERYERTRPHHQNPAELLKHRFSGYGTRNRLLDLLEANALS